MNSPNELPPDSRDVAIAWDKSAKGRGNRWRMMRDVIAMLALRPLNLTQLQDALMRLRGITRRKTHEMLEELERAGDVKAVSGQVDGEVIAGYSSTDRGVHYWLGGTRRGIPAGVVRVLPTLTYVPKSDPPGEPEYQDI